MHRRAVYTGTLYGIDPLYEQDFYAWTMHQAALLREGHITKLDLHNLAAEVESLGRRDKRELRDRLHVLMMHLLKWCYQPAGQTWGGSWAGSIRQQRRQITALLDDSPSLTAQVETLLERRLRQCQTGCGSRNPASTQYFSRDVSVDDAGPPGYRLLAAGIRQTGGRSFVRGKADLQKRFAFVGRPCGRHWALVAYGVPPSAPTRVRSQDSASTLLKMLSERAVANRQKPRLLPY